MNVNLSKIPKVTNFTHFVPEIFHINPSKIVYIYPSVSIMYIYTVNVGLQINILFYFLSHWSELSLLPHFTLFLSISLSLSSSKEHSRSTIHPSTTSTQHHPITTITTHNNPTKKSMENQTKNQQKIEPKIKPKLMPKLLSPVPWKLGWSVRCYHERVKIWTTVYGGVAIGLCWADRERKRVLGSIWLEEWKSGRMKN